MRETREDTVPQRESEMRTIQRDRERRLSSLSSLSLLSPLILSLLSFLSLVLVASFFSFFCLNLFSSISAHYTLFPLFSLYLREKREREKKGFFLFVSYFILLDLYFNLPLFLFAFWNGFTSQNLVKREEREEQTRENSEKQTKEPLIYFLSVFLSSSSSSLFPL